MITEIRLENFKSFKELTKIPLKKITVFIGPNGAGKSTPLQALMLLKQSYDAQRIDAKGPEIDLGDSSELRSLESPGDTYALGFTYEKEGPGGQELVDADVAVGAGGFIRAPYHELDAQHHQRETVLKLVYYVPSWRGFGKSALEIGENENDDLLASHGAEDVAIAVATRLGREPRLQRTIGKWLERITESTVSTVGHGLAKSDSWVHALESEPSAPAPKQKVLSRLGEDDINIVNEGFGVNQLVHLLLQLALCPKGSFLAIEEPEAHLHPKAQVLLTKVLLERAKEKDLQLVLITHSEHVLHTLLNQVGKGSFTPKEVGLLYFRKEDGVSKVEERAINKQGQVKGGLPGFFEVELEQFSEFVEALSKQE